MANKKQQVTIFRLTYKNDKPSTEGRHYPVSHRIPSIDEVFDEKTGRNRKIQYVLGEQSIYADEQSSFNPVLGDIVFNNGSLPVQYQQVTLREFLEKTNYNKSNPNRMKTKKSIFETIDLETDAEKDLENLEVEFHAMESLMSMDAQKMVGYARAMGVNIDRSMYEIKHDMMVMAKNDPELFMEQISNPKLERKQVIMDAEDERIIVINTSKREVKWGTGSKQLITVIPVGINPYDHFVDYSFESEGKEVFNKIVKLLKGETLEVKEKKSTKKEKVVSSK
tara:strand:- start:23930 stop:24769 length:840 start_codon:yes stop_codon:yes gene_type:complete